MKKLTVMLAVMLASMSILCACREMPQTEPAVEETVVTEEVSADEETTEVVTDEQTEEVSDDTEVTDDSADEAAVTSLLCSVSGITGCKTLLTSV